MQIVSRQLDLELITPMWQYIGKAKHEFGRLPDFCSCIREGGLNSIDLFLVTAVHRPTNIQQASRDSRRMAKTSRNVWSSWCICEAIVPHFWPFVFYVVPSSFLAWDGLCPGAGSPKSDRFGRTAAVRTPSVETVVCVKSYLWKRQLALRPTLFWVPVRSWPMWDRANELGEVSGRGPYQILAVGAGSLTLQGRWRKKLRPLDLRWVAAIAAVAAVRLLLEETEVTAELSLTTGLRVCSTGLAPCSQQIVVDPIQLEARAGSHSWHWV